MFHKLNVRRWAACLAIGALPFAIGCGAPEAPVTLESEEADAAAGLRDALLFHAGFDNGWDAGFATGDAQLYTAPSYKELDKATPGLGNPDAEIVPDAGIFQHALRFNKKNQHAIFYRAENNLAYSEAAWNGTISFWLSLDPASDLEPGFCDPLQVTDAAYNDGAIWVDFTPENPRQFRLGVFGDLNVWNPENIPQDKNPVFANRVVVVDPPPFTRENWTHVVVTHEGLGSAQGGEARLYLDAACREPRPALPNHLPGMSPRPRSRLGVNYVGLFDELAIFNRPLLETEIQALAQLERGVSDLLLDYHATAR